MLACGKCRWTVLVGQSDVIDRDEAFVVRQAGSSSRGAYRQLVDRWADVNSSLEPLGALLCRNK